MHLPQSCGRFFFLKEVFGVSFSATLLMAQKLISYQIADAIDEKVFVLN